MHPPWPKDMEELKVKISQFDCKRFKVKSHSLTLGLKRAIQSWGLTLKEKQIVTKADHMDASPQEVVREQIRPGSLKDEDSGEEQGRMF